MKRFTLVTLFTLALFVISCSSQTTREIEPGIITPEGVSTGHRLLYFYDEVHEVGIWILVADSNDIAVLPKSQFANPEEPMSVK